VQLGQNGQLQEKIMLTVPEAAQILRIDKVTVYELAKSNGFPALRIGRRVLIPRDALLRWIEAEAMKEHAAV
jgi:excisionase family DNA binding protein